MAVERTLFVKSVAWGGYTWNAGDGGTLSLTIRYGGRVISDYAGGDMYPRAVAIIDRTLEATLRLRSPVAIDADDLGTSDDMTVDLETPEAVTIGLSRMRLTDISVGQDRGAPSELTLNFVHESSDGSAVPISLGS